MCEKILHMLKARRYAYLEKFQPFASINPLCLQCNIYMEKKLEKRNSDGKIKSIVFECPRCGNVEYYLPHRKFEEM